MIDLLEPGGETKPDLDESRMMALIAATLIGDSGLIKGLLIKGVGPFFERPYPFPQPIQVTARQGHQDAGLVLLQYSTTINFYHRIFIALQALAAERQDHVVHLLLEQKYERYTSVQTHGSAILSAAAGGQIG